MLNQRTDIDIEVVVGPGWGSWPLELTAEKTSIPVHVLPQILSGKNHFHWYRGLSQIVKKFHPNLMHIDEEHYSLVTAQAMKIAKNLNIPAVFQTWQNIYKKYPWPFSAIERFVFDTSVQALAGTQSISDVLRQKGYNKPISIIPLGTDTDIFYPDRNPAYRSRWGLTQNFVIGFIGRLVEEKGVMDLLDAMMPILGHDRNIKLVITGDGPLRQKIITRLKSENVGDRVIMNSWISSQDMPQLINSLDVLAVPSRTTPHWKEQFGRVLTEAMAVGVPIIGSDSGEIPHVVGPAGLIIPEASPSSLRNAVISLYHDKSLRQQFAEAGILRVRQQFSQEIVAAKLANFYADLMS